MSKYPNSYIQYLAHFHGDRDYFECHEILEEYWKATDAGNKSSIWVAFILLAVSNYHYRRKNFTGAKRTLRKAKEIFTDSPQYCQRLGIDPDALLQLLRKRERSLNDSIPYYSFNLPLTDPDLLKLCQKECKENGFQWGSRSDLNDAELINRHSSRDRSEVIIERKLALDEKNRARKK
jgi:uncharacterized protein